MKMSDMTTVETCKQCGLSYRLSLAFPHECAEWTKGRQSTVEHEQPAPEGESWRVEYTHGRGYRVNDSLGCLAEVRDRVIAEGIVRDHRLAALVPGLVEALRGVQIRGCWCELPPNITSPDHTIECDAARAVLNAVAKELQ